MKIENSIPNDIYKIMEIYDKATAYMKFKNQVSWPKFSKEMILTDIDENRQWKLLINGEIACIWTTTFNDPIIWGAKNNDPAVYIHRIATNPIFRGNNLIEKLVEWVKIYAKKNNKSFIRMDTVGFNKSLINLYEKIGFIFLGTNKLNNVDGLPDHYKKGNVCFFEIKL